MLKRLENLHILFWLVKDLCWCLVFKGLGVAMVIPTFFIAVYIAVKSYKKSISDFVHNMAVLCWISANSVWMITEFYKMEDNFFGTGLHGKYVAAVFFVIGIVIPFVYYIHRLYQKFIT
jgi:hypothetical protein